MKRKQQWEYITVVRQPQKARVGHPSEKMQTRVFDIRLMNGRTSVGKVRWHNREHRYVFISKQGPESLPKSSAILRDISRFLDILMKEREGGIK